MKNQLRYWDNENVKVSKCQLIKAVKKFFIGSDILKICVNHNESIFVVEWDGICCTQWEIEDCFDFIDAMADGYLYNDEKYRIIKDML